MAETVYYMVTCQPRVNEDSASQPTDGFSLRTILSATNFNALKLFIQKLQQGKDASSVVSAINSM